MNFLKTNSHIFLKAGSLGMPGFVAGHICRQQKKDRIPAILWKRETGLGPATFALARRHSTTEPLAHLNAPSKLHIYNHHYIIYLKNINIFSYPFSRLSPVLSLVKPSTD